MVSINTSISLGTVKTRDRLVGQYGALSLGGTRTLVAVGGRAIESVTIEARRTSVACITGSVVVANASTLCPALVCLVPKECFRPTATTVTRLVSLFSL